jgi:RimJ/RimL family protein N-acetyltransferase
MSGRNLVGGGWRGLLGWCHDRSPNAAAFLRATAAHGDQRPFGCYRITRTADGKAIGGIGFKGQPNNGCVEVGYGLVPSARGNGYAAEALAALLNVVADHGLSRVVADTDKSNLASQRTLQRAGFHRVGGNGDLCTYEILNAAPSGSDTDAVAPRHPQGARSGAIPVLRHRLSLTGTTARIRASADLTGQAAKGDRGCPGGGPQWESCPSLAMGALSE